MPDHTTLVSPWGQGEHCKAPGQQGAPSLGRGAPHISPSVHAALRPSASPRHPQSTALGSWHLTALLLSTWEVTADHPAVHLTLRISDLDLPGCCLSEAPIHLKLPWTFTQLAPCPRFTAVPRCQASRQPCGVPFPQPALCRNEGTRRPRAQAPGPPGDHGVEHQGRGPPGGTLAREQAFASATRPTPGVPQDGNGTQRVVTTATPKKRSRPVRLGPQAARATGGSGQGLFCRIILHTHSDTRVLLLNLFETCFP